jgi:hypothetical protein
MNFAIGNRAVVCEFMGKHSNIILVNPENQFDHRCHQTLWSEVSTHREVSRALNISLLLIRVN